MNVGDKINVYVPTRVKDRLYEDARLFEVFKRDRLSINPNRFLNLLVTGYSQTYAEEYNDTKAKLIRELTDSGLDTQSSEAAASRVMKNVLFPVEQRRVGRNLCRLPLKPSAANEGRFLEIVESLTADDSLAGYLCRMLQSYCEKASSERERIIHSESYAVLASAIERSETVSFSTPWSRDYVHRVIPFTLAIGQNEQFNYLLCGEEVDGVQEARAYRLCRVMHPRKARSSATLKDDVRAHLKEMSKHGPQFAINEDVEACVRLTEEGVNSFMRIYSDRPVPDRVELREEDYLYHFRCSLDQLFLYFRRFGPGEAEILAPASLRRRLIEFHEGALRMYGQDTEHGVS